MLWPFFFSNRFTISSIELDNFDLSPGDGGKKFMTADNNAGRGGGGVLVQVGGAQDESSSPESNGEGFGFGGGYREGGQGVVLMEIKII